MSALRKFNQFCTSIILTLLIIYLGSKVNYIFKPIQSLVNTIIIPFMLAIFFYYLLRPLVNLFESYKVNKNLSVLIIFFVITVMIGGFIIGVWPLLRAEVVNLLHNAPTIFLALRELVEEWDRAGFFSQNTPVDENPLTRLTESLSTGFTWLMNYMLNFISLASNFMVILCTFPLILFFMLKEGANFPSTMVHFIPKRFREEVVEIMEDIDRALNSFILGRVLVNVALGILMYIGFLFIDLPYALLLSVVAIILNFIPFIGAFLSAIPVVIIGFIQSPSIAIWSLVVILLTQQIQDNILSPYIFGKQLDIHPLTTIILVLVGGDLAGILGMLLVIPLYVIIKIIFKKVYQLFLKERWEEL